MFSHHMHIWYVDYSKGTYVNMQTGVSCFHVMHTYVHMFGAVGCNRSKKQAGYVVFHNAGHLMNGEKM